jgi:hypothetical protein
MLSIFATLHNLHPLLPVVWFVIFVNGISGPTVYCIVQRMPVDIGRVWQLAKQRRPGAMYVIGSWAFMCLFTVITLLLQAK